MIKFYYIYFSHIRNFKNYFWTGVQLCCEILHHLKNSPLAVLVRGMATPETREGGQLGLAFPQGIGGALFQTSIPFPHSYPGASAAQPWALDFYQQ